MLKCRTTNYVIESSIPSDTFIEDVIKDFYMDGLVESTGDEASIKKVLYESLLETLPKKLDYRNNTVDVAAKSLYSVATNSNLSEHLRNPLLMILEGIGYSDKNQEETHQNNGGSISPVNRYDLTSPVYEEIQESDVYEFVLALSKENWIPFRNLDRYVQGLTESVWRTQQELMRMLCVDGIDREVTESISNNIHSSVTYSYPNEGVLDTILESMIRESKDPNATVLVTDEELETLTNDFLTDDDLSSLPDPQGEVYRMLSEFVSCIYQDLETEDNYENMLNAILKFHAGYVKHPTKMLHNTAILLSLYLTKMFNCCSNRSIQQDIELMYIYLLGDMCDFRDVDLTDGSTDTDVAYGDLLNMWNSNLPSVSFGLKDGGLDSTNISSDEPFEIEFPDFEEPVTESHGVLTGRKSSELIKTLTESFEVLQDGTIKVTIPKKSTYMDEYAENHRLLLANRKVKNYEGMKYNLIYHLILIDSIEKNVMHNTKVKKDSALYEDAMKARSFAKNDISTYLPEVRQHVKDFDINRFYKEVRAEQSTIQINGVETARGVKKIIKSILL